MRWILPSTTDPLLTRHLADALRVPLWVAELLVRRGLGDAAAADLFLHPRLKTLSDPFLLSGMDAAVTRLLAAIDNKERIAIYGDYDVDGVTSLTILSRVLRAFGANVATFLPHRVDEGYGLTSDGVARCVELHQPQLLLAVDCGTTAVAEVTQLRDAGVDVLIFDHHEPKSELPPAVALVNPKLDGKFTYLCSAGLSFKVAHALLKRRPLPGFDLKEMLDLVALGTVADIVPLVDENRVLVRAGLERLAQTRWVGLKALIEVAGLNPPFNASHVGFGLGPRLNAAGRLGTAEAALELLLTDDPVRARLLAKALDQQNQERRGVEDEVLSKAEAQLISCFDPQSDAAIVVGAPGWHPGVLGIVASRLLRRHHRPTFVVGFDAHGVGKGSGRSIEGLSLVEAAGQCAELLEKFGGHEMAAGLTMRQEHFLDFRAAFLRVTRSLLTDEQLQPRLRLDSELQFRDIGPELLEQYEALQPFGAPHPQPLFFSSGVTLGGEPRVMKEKHLSLSLLQRGRQCRAVWWNAASQELPPEPWDVAFTVERNEWQGRVSVQLHVRAVRSTEA